MIIERVEKNKNYYPLITNTPYGFLVFSGVQRIFVRNLTVTIHRLLLNGIDEKFIWKFTYK